MNGPELPEGAIRPSIAALRDAIAAAPDGTSAPDAVSTPDAMSAPGPSLAHAPDRPADAALDTPEPTTEEAAARRNGARTATRSGRPVVALRIDERTPAGEVEVEVDVYPLNSLRVEPLRPGPFRFASTDAAERFVDEVLLTLRYLGCEIAA